MSDYHQHPAVSKTGLKCFRQSRRLYHARHVLRLPEAQLVPTAQMNIGTLAHAELLEPGSLEGKYAVLKDWDDFKTKAARQWRDEQTAAGKTVVKAHEVASVIAVVKATVEKVSPWFTPEAVIETPIFWQDRDTKLDCRAKPDWLIVTSKIVVAFDFKTTPDASPAAFERQSNALSLWIQERHYSAGLAEKYERPVDFYFVTTETEYPYRVSVNQIERTEAMHAEYRDTLAALAKCYETDDWREPWEDRINQVKVWERSLRSDAMACAED